MTRYIVLFLMLCVVARVEAESPPAPEIKRGADALLYPNVDAKVIYKNFVTLNWAAPTQNTDGSALKDLAGYRVHWWSQSNPNRKVVDIGKKVAHRVDGLNYGETYFFAISAYSESGLESNLSSEIAFRLQPPESQKECKSL